MKITDFLKNSLRFSAKKVFFSLSFFYASEKKSQKKELVFAGEYTYGHEQAIVKSWNNKSYVRIGRFCSISEGVLFILGGNHDLNSISTYPFGHTNVETFGFETFNGHPLSKGDIEIGNDVWLAYGVTIMSGVQISDGAVVGAKSVVTKNIGPYEVWAGNPAKFIKLRFSEDVVSLLQDVKWWDLNPKSIKEIRHLLNAQPSKENLDKLRAHIREVHKCSEP